MGVTGAVATRGTQVQETGMMSSIAKRRYKEWVEIPENIKNGSKEDFVKHVEDEILSQIKSHEIRRRILKGRLRTRTDWKLKVPVNNGPQTRSVDLAQN